jgi:hypothetical protein
LIDSTHEHRARRLLFATAPKGAREMLSLFTARFGGLVSLECLPDLMGYGARFSTGIYTRGVPLSFSRFCSAKRCHACDQWYSSRVSTFLTSSHCKLRPNTEGT